ncbi:hypothetical protein KUTeg_023839 [Tegillarca granosa]|uniref:Secreted protein n=1 Tax=Tegillarca granosa TaxID=220873 RepID=A0ABQ9E2T9_TEGGR|nr:hypothetical protein KUTeg_023839 [Tegillarca granosa]
MMFNFLLHSITLMFMMGADGNREFRIAWMAPRSEHFSLSAASSVCALKLALNSDHITRILQNATVNKKF